MTRITELRSFVSVFFNSVKTLQMLADAVPTTSKPVLAKYAVVEYSYAQHRQLVNEIMLSRAVETFDLYVQHILMEIFRARPDMLRSEAAIDVATVLDLKTLDDIVFHIAERKLHELSFKPLSELRKYIESRTGIELFPSEKAYHIALVASELRNLVAHNDCIVNDVFLRRVVEVPGRPAQKGEAFAIADEWVRMTSYGLDAIVFDFDEAVVRKFGLQAVRSADLILTRRRPSTLPHDEAQPSPT